MNTREASPYLEQGVIDQAVEVISFRQIMAGYTDHARTLHHPPANLLEHNASSTSMSVLRGGLYRHRIDETVASHPTIQRLLKDPFDPEYGIARLSIHGDVESMQAPIGWIRLHAGIVVREIFRKDSDYGGSEYERTRHSYSYRNGPLVEKQIAQEYKTYQSFENCLLHVRSIITRYQQDRRSAKESMPRLLWNALQPAMHCLDNPRHFPMDAEGQNDTRATFIQALSEAASTLPWLTACMREYERSGVPTPIRTFAGHNSVLEILLNGLLKAQSTIEPQRQKEVGAATDAETVQKANTDAGVQLETVTRQKKMIALSYVIALLGEIHVEECKADLGNIETITCCIVKINALVPQIDNSIGEITRENIIDLLQSLHFSTTTSSPEMHAPQQGGLYELIRNLHELQDRRHIRHSVTHTTTGEQALRMAHHTIGWGATIATKIRSYAAAHWPTAELEDVAHQLRQVLVSHPRRAIAVALAITAGGVWCTQNDSANTHQSLAQPTDIAPSPGTSPAVRLTVDNFVGHISPEVQWASAAGQAAQGIPVVHPDIRRPATLRTAEPILLPPQPTERQFASWVRQSLTVLRADLQSDLGRLAAYHTSTSLDDMSMSHIRHLAIRSGLPMYPKTNTPDVKMLDTLESMIREELRFLEDKSAVTHLLAYFAVKTKWGAVMQDNNPDNANMQISDAFVREQPDLVGRMTRRSDDGRYLLTYGDGVEAMQDAVGRFLRKPEFKNALITTSAPSNGASRLGYATMRAVHTIMGEGHAKAYAAALQKSRIELAALAKPKKTSPKR